MIRVLIVDDHPIVRKGLRSELSEQPDILVVEEASNAEEALIRAQSCKPDIVLLDISLPGRSGLEVLRQLKVEMPHVKVLMLSTYPAKQYAMRCLKDGAMGYLTKESLSAELLTAIRKVDKGRKYISQQLGEILASDFGKTKDFLPHEKLSGREFEILCLIAKGETPAGIAGILSVSPSTVSTHKLHILTKMQMNTTAELIRYCVDHGLAGEAR